MSIEECVGGIIIQFARAEDILDNIIGDIVENEAAVKWLRNNMIGKKLEIVKDLLATSRDSEGVQTISEIKALLKIRNMAAHDSSYHYIDEDHELYIGWNLKSFDIRNIESLKFYADKIELAINDLNGIWTKITFTKSGDIK